MRKICVALSLCLLLLVAMALPPTLLCLRWPFDWLSAHINQQIPGVFSRGACSLGWFEGLHCRNLAYEATNGAWRLEADEAHGNKGLLALLLAPHNLGELRLIGAVLSLELGGNEKISTEAHSLPAAAKNKLLVAPWWQQGAFTLNAQDGLVQYSKGEEKIFIADHTAFIGQLGQGSFQYHLQTRIGSGQESNCSGQGFFNIPPPERNWRQGSVWGLDLSMQETQVPDLPWLIPQLQSRLLGQAQGKLHLMSDGGGLLKIDLEAQLDKLLFKNANLANDKALLLQQVTLAMNLSRSEQDAWRLNALKLDSPAFNLSSLGEWQAGVLQMVAKAQLQLPWLSTQLKSQLAINPEARIEEGAIDCRVQAKGPLQELTFDGDCAASAIQGHKGTEPFSWQASPILLAQGLWRHQELRMNELHFRTPYFSGKATQQKNGLEGRFSANLSQMSKAMRQLFLLPYSAGGNLEWKFRATSQTLKDNRIQSDLAIERCSLQDAKSAAILPAHPLRLSLDAAAKDKTIQARLIASAWPGGAQLNLQGLRRERNQLHGTYKIKVDTRLERLETLQTLLPGKRFFAPNLELKGAFSGEAEGDMVGQRYSINTLQARLTKLHFHHPLLAMRDENIEMGLGILPAKQKCRCALAPLRLEAQQDEIKAAVTQAAQPGKNFFDLETRQLQLSSFFAQSSAFAFDASLHAHQLAGAEAVNPIDQAKAPPPEHPHHPPPSSLAKVWRYTAQAQGQAHAALTKSLLQAQHFLPKGLDMHGVVQAQWSASNQANGAAQGFVAAQIDKVVHVQAGKYAYTNGPINLAFNYTQPAGIENNLALHTLTLQGPNLWAEGEGELLRQDMQPAILMLSGVFRNHESATKNTGQTPAPNNAAIAKPFQLAWRMQN